MNDQIASIWVSVHKQGSKKILICGIYREHQYLHQLTDLSHRPSEQLKQVENVPESGGPSQVNLQMPYSV